LEKTIRSVVGQTFTDFEYVVIDGASTDGSVEVIQEYEDRIDYWVSEPDSGIYNSMNKGIEACTGEFILFLNSGDILLSRWSLEKVMSKIQKNDIIVLWDIYTGKNIWNLPKVNMVKHFINSFVGHSGCALFNAKVFQQVGKYDESYLLHGDREFYYRLIEKYNDNTFRKIPGLYSVFEPGGSPQTNKYRGQHSKAEKRRIEATHSDIFRLYFRDYTYRYHPPLLTRVINKFQIRILPLIRTLKIISSL